MSHKLAIGALIVLSIMVSVVAAVTPLPEGYVGGTVLPNGDVMGGHPSQEVLDQYKLADDVVILLNTVYPDSHYWKPVDGY